MSRKIDDKDRLRAPSAKSLAAQGRILDAAEKLFSLYGFDGASLRDIGKAAEVSAALVAHHGGTKDELFEKGVARRAAELSALRLALIEEYRQAGQLDLAALVEAYVTPLLSRAVTPDGPWVHYARLVAHVSTDERWSAITSKWFDPTAARFVEELGLLLPGVAPEVLRARYVFMVSATLSVPTALWRMGENADPARAIQELKAFCLAGFKDLAV
jgi:AcrR family transcriptional regulator